MIYQVLAKVFLICSDSLTVVPAKAGTHDHRDWIRCEWVLPMGKVSAYYVCILASGQHGTLYIGVTNNVRARLELHRAGRGSKFVQQYKVYRLVHVETFATSLEAIAREKQLKNWQRRWKIRLIEENNVGWADLSDLL